MHKSPRFMIRLDDACPVMKRESWDRMEALLDRFGIKPLVAVIPDNTDPSLDYGTSDPDFWPKVRAWQEKGWTLALHGLHHAYHASGRGLVPFHKKSEYTGLPIEAQRALIQEGMDILLSHQLQVDWFVAPSHNFDAVTLQALVCETAIRTISDGISRWPYIKDGFTWVPQQLWRPRRVGNGLWTLCYHPNTMTDNQFMELESFLKNSTSSFIRPEDSLQHVRPYGLAARLFRMSFLILLRFKQLLAKRRG